MTEQDMDVEKEEIEQLKKLLRTSTEHLSLHAREKDEPKKRKRDRTSGDEKDDNVDNEKNLNENHNDKKNSQESDLQMEHDGKDADGNEEKIQYITDETEVILPSRKKKAPKKKVVELTPEELKSAKAKHKAMQRKLNQIEERHERKKRRKELYATISEHALSETEMNLLGKSSELGKRVSKKEVLKKLLQKERAGIVLTGEEKNVLYTNTEHDEEAYEEHFGATAQGKEGTRDLGSSEMVDEDEVVPLSFSSSRKKKKKTSKDKDNAKKSNADMKDVEMTKEVDQESAPSKPKDEEPKEVETPKFSFASQMMSGLSTLKTSAALQKEDLDKQRAKDQEELEEKRRREEEEERKKRKVHVPQNPAILKSAAVMGLKPKVAAIGKDGWRVLPVERPAEVNAKRYDLPVNSMEYEIIDSIRNNSVTIICSETGSGKSTQVPQFLYESGVTLGNAKARGEDDGLLICVTQPRRVAAVSTAKRVCYEMGHSKDKGQSIQGRKGEGNVVAYQTKYETAGLGPKTRVKFMTDGILLQEIKSDLLLRKYAGEYRLQCLVICDEFEECETNYLLTSSYLP